MSRHSFHDAGGRVRLVKRGVKILDGQGAHPALAQLGPHTDGNPLENGGQSGQSRFQAVGVAVQFGRGQPQTKSRAPVVVARYKVIKAEAVRTLARQTHSRAATTSGTSRFSRGSAALFVKGPAYIDTAHGVQPYPFENATSSRRELSVAFIHKDLSVIPVVLSRTGLPPACVSRSNAREAAGR